MSSSSSFAVAFDLGTTTIATALVSLPDGKVIARTGSLNPQREFGLDVVARLTHASGSPENLLGLQLLINSELSRLAAELADMAGVDHSCLQRAAIAGNTVMSHLLLGLPVGSLTRPPYRPRTATGSRVMSGELGWALNLPVYVFPSPGGFVGGDTVAFLFGAGFPEPASAIPDPVLFLDLGTNGEMALFCGGKLYATSVAAGPAFEGGNLSSGMAALEGAIDSLCMENGRLVWSTIGGGVPAGLCGSGILDAMALLLAEGLMEPDGRLLNPSELSTPLGNRLQEMEGEMHFVVYRDASRVVSISQTDIRQVQLAKGAVRAGIEVLLEKARIGTKDLAGLVLTGSFGASLRLESLKSIGVLDENMVINARFIREGVLAGVVRSLVAPGAFDMVENLAASLFIIPLSGTPLFERHFMGNMDFHV